MRNAIIVIVLFLLAFWILEAVGGGDEQPTRKPVERVSVAFTSDPTGSAIWVDGEHRGSTPTEVSVPKGEEVFYRIVPNEPYEDYDLYEPFSSSITADDDTAVDVWVERTAQEEQAAQIQAAEERRAEETRRRAEAEQRRRAAEEARQRELEARRLYYRIDTNCTRGADLTYSNANGDSTQQANQGSGWYYYFHPRDGQFLYLSAQNQCDYGYITVKFVQDGVTLRENTSTGAYVIASISGRW